MSPAPASYTHMTLLSESTEGMHNLFRLASRASLEGFFYKPRADRELLHEYAKGLIATTGCPSGEIQTWLRIGNYEKARASAAEFRDIFGKENYFLELMDHGLSIETKVRDGLLRLAKDLQLPMVATNDLHYTDAADADAHEALLCVQSGKTHGRPEPVQVRRPRLLPQVAGRDARAVGRQVPAAGGLRQHPADRRALRGRVRRERLLHAAVPGAGGRDRADLVRQGGRAAGLAVRFPDGHPARGAEAGRLRGRRHHRR